MLTPIAATNTLQHSECVSWAPVPAGCIHAGGVSTGSARQASSAKAPLIHWVQRVPKCTEQHELVEFHHRLPSCIQMMYLTGDTLMHCRDVFLGKNTCNNWYFRLGGWSRSVVDDFAASCPSLHACMHTVRFLQHLLKETYMLLFSVFINDSFLVILLVHCQKSMSVQKLMSCLFHPKSKKYQII